MDTPPEVPNSCPTRTRVRIRVSYFITFTTRRSFGGVVSAPVSAPAPVSMSVFVQPRKEAHVTNYTLNPSMNQSFKPRLREDGIFVTQAGPAGVFSHTEVFSCIFNTLRQVFRYVVPYSAHIPSYADTWGWILASNSPLPLDADELDMRTRLRIDGENRYLDGKTFPSASNLSKAVRKLLAKEIQVYTEGADKFIYGHGSFPKLQNGAA